MIFDKQDLLTKISQSGGRELYNASDELKADKEVVLAAVNNIGHALQYASDATRLDKDVVYAAVSQDGLALQYALESMRGDKEVGLAAVKNDAWALQYASGAMRSDKDVVLAAVSLKGRALCYASDSMRGDKEVVLAAVNNDGGSLDYASDNVKADKKVVLAAVNQGGDALKFASDAMRADKEVLLAVVGSNLASLVYALDAMRSNKEVVYAAYYKEANFALHYASAKLQSDIAVVESRVILNIEDVKDLVNSCWENYILLPIEYKLNLRVCQAAVDMNVCAVRHIPSEFLKSGVSGLDVNRLNVDYDNLDIFRYIPESNLIENEAKVREWAENFGVELLCYLPEKMQNTVMKYIASESSGENLSEIATELKVMINDNDLGVNIAVCMGLKDLALFSMTAKSKSMFGSSGLVSALTSLN